MFPPPRGELWVNAAHKKTESAQAQEPANHPHRTVNQTPHPHTLNNNKRMMPAVTYSPTPSQVQYHRRRQA